MYDILDKYVNGREQFDNIVKQISNVGDSVFETEAGILKQLENHNDNNAILVFFIVRRKNVDGEMVCYVEKQAFLPKI